MKTLAAGILTVAGLLAFGTTAQAQYWPYGTGYGFYPGVNQTVISVSPYWRPLVINTPVVSTPYGPNYYYSNYYNFRTTPFGYNWSAYRYQWVNTPNYYYPPAIAYPTYPVPFVAPANPILPAVAVAPVRGRLYPGFIPTVSPLNVTYTPPASNVLPAGGSFTAWGAYLPGTGTYLNPFSGAVVR